MLDVRVDFGGHYGWGESSGKFGQVAVDKVQRRGVGCVVAGFVENPVFVQRE